MEYLFQTTLENTEDRPIDYVLKYLEYHWFDRYYRFRYFAKDFASLNLYSFTNDGPLVLKIREIKKPYKAAYLYGKIKDTKTLLYFLWNNMCQFASKEFYDIISKQYKYIDGSLKEVSIPPSRFLYNVANSCALDSLLAIMCFTRGGYFMARVFGSTPIETREFKGTDFLAHVDIKEAKIRGIRIEEALLKLYNSENFRDIKELQKDVVYFSESSCTDIKAVYELWNVLCSLFDGLPVRLLTKRMAEIGNTPEEYYSISVLEGEQDYVEMPDHLVYFNDNIVEETDFEAMGFTRERNGYQLVGIVYHVANHYICRLKVHEEWYRYDDVNTRIVPDDSADILKSGRLKIVMLFYTKN